MKQRCKMTDEQRYWTEFESSRHQFCKVMVGDYFKDELRIPRNFKDNFKENLQKTIGLRGPSGHVWEVKLTKGTEDWFFQNGWENFAQDHSLGAGDFLVFSYDENSTFKVTIFGKTGCEKEGAYFIEKDSSYEEKDTQKGKLKEGRGNRSFKGVVISEGRHQKKGFREREVKSKNTVASRQNESPTPSDVEIVPSNCKRMKRRTEYVNQVPDLGMSESREGVDLVELESDDENSYTVTSHGLRQKKHWTDKSQAGDGGSQDDSGSEEIRLPETKYTFYLMSKRRKVTEEEIQRAKILAKKHQVAEPSITLVMKPTNVYKYFYLNIPKQWARFHMPRTNNSKIYLKVPPSENIWSVRWKCHNNKTGFSKGWSKFVMDNNLEEHDACVFQLIKGSGKRTMKIPVFNVIIFRVLDEIVPLKHLIKKPQLKQ